MKNLSTLALTLLLGTSVFADEVDAKYSTGHELDKDAKYRLIVAKSVAKTACSPTPRNQLEEMNGVNFSKRDEHCQNVHRECLPGYKSWTWDPWNSKEDEFTDSFGSKYTWCQWATSEVNNHRCKDILAEVLSKFLAEKGVTFDSKYDDKIFEDSPRCYDASILDGGSAGSRSRSSRGSR